MKRCTLCVSLICAVLFSFVPNLSAGAGVSVSLKSSQASVDAGSEFQYAVALSCNEAREIAAFRLTLTFDSSMAEFKGIEPSKLTDATQFDYNNAEINETSNNQLTIVFLSEDEAVPLKKGASEAIFYLRFRASESLTPGKFPLKAEMDGIADENVNELPCNEIKIDDIEITAKQLPDCTLSSLSIEGVTLEPEFSPNVYEYTVSVPYETDRLEISATPSDENAKVTISRKTLEKAGTPTNISVTVTAADKRMKIIYKITVNRQEKEGATGTNDTSSTGSNGKNSSGKNSAGKTSSNALSGSHGSTKNTSGATQKNATVPTNGTPSSDDPLFCNDGENTALTQGKQIVVKESDFAPFMLGALIVICPILTYVVYQHFAGKKEDGELGEPNDGCTQ